MVLNIHCMAISGNVSPSKQVEEEESEGKVDDWQFKPEETHFETQGIHSKSRAALKSASPIMLSASSADTIGFSTGGAKDINNFRENIKNNFLPIPSDVTYEGLFYDYFFETGESQPCNQLFCPSYTSALSKDPFSGKEEYFLSVGLNSDIKQSDFSRKKLHLVIVLDISGSMTSPFNRFYYDQFNKGEREQPEKDEKEWEKTKMQIATQSVVALLDHLNPEDSLGVVLFNHTAHLAKPLRTVGSTDMEAIKGHILEIPSLGGTNMSSGIEMAGELLKKYSSTEDKEVEKRIIFLTDAQPNTGELSEKGMTGITKAHAEQKIYTTFIGIGVDFNTELIETISKIRGTNYYAVHSPTEFKKQMDKNFDYMVTPLVFNLQLKIKAPGFEIQKVYGSPEANESTGEIMKVNTLFPSEKKEGEIRGGLVLLQLKKLPDNKENTLQLNVSYEDRNGKKSSNSMDFVFQDNGKQEYYDNKGIQKGIALSRYATLMKNWILHERTKGKSPEGSNQRKGDSLLEMYRKHGIPFFHDPGFELSKWERQSQKLTVSEEYKELINKFIPYFEKEMKSIGDDFMQKEMNILNLLASHSN